MVVDSNAPGRVTLTGSCSIREWFPHCRGVVIAMYVLWRQQHRHLRSWWLYGSLVRHYWQHQEHTREHVQWRPLDLRHELPGKPCVWSPCETPLSLSMSGVFRVRFEGDSLVDRCPQSTA